MKLLKELYSLPTEFVTRRLEPEWFTGWYRKPSDWDSGIGPFYSYVHYVNGKIHKDDGPAYIEMWAKNEAEYFSVAWFQNGQYHNTNGPAKFMLKEESVNKTENININDYDCLFYIDGIYLLDKEFWEHPKAIIAKLNKIIST